MASIGIFGAGYVGLVTGACFAELGHDVVVRDVVPERIDALRRGEVPIYEPGLEELLERNSERVGYASNPEFTAEGTAVRDFMRPDRVVVGSFDEADGEAVAALHAGIDAQVVHMDVASAEMVKLASNAFLMTRISFINEIANVCEATGADVVRVAEAVGLDRRLGPHFLRAGIGYGGSCLEGSESVLVREVGLTRLTTLEELFDHFAENGTPSA